MKEDEDIYVAVVECIGYA